MDCAISVGSCGFAEVVYAQIATLGLKSNSSSIIIIGLKVKVIITVNYAHICFYESETLIVVGFRVHLG